MPVLEQEPVLTLKTYESNFDRRDYANKNTKDKVKLDRYTIRQVETLLGERLNVLLSESRYDIKNGVIYGENMNEPFMDVMVRGRDYISRIAGVNRVDREREQAEVDGFTIIQEIFCHPSTPIGTMIISVSPPGGDGSLYKHNFYDIFALKEEKGQRYIEAKRYSSGLSVEEYRRRLSQLYPKIYGENIKLTDAYFLSHPVVASSFFQDADSLHKHLHSNHKYMEEKDFEEVIRACMSLILSYIDALSKEPEDIDKHNLILNAVLNKADIEAKYHRHSGEEFYIAERRLQNLSASFMVKREMTLITMSLQPEIEFLGRQPVRETTTGCPGGSGGFGKKNNNLGSIDNMLSHPFSVAEFGMDQEWFTCPKCKYQADGPIGDGPCPGCGLTKEEFAKESSKPICE